MRTPEQVRHLECEASCIGIGIREWEKKMKGATRANKRVINRLVKQHLPGLYYELALNFYNPYEYYKNDKYLILVHSSIEYFLRYKI